MDPELDLAVERVIRAPRADVWRAWTDPDQLAQWWLPSPIVGRVDRLEVRPGGAFVTSMSDGGDFVPHVDGCVIEVEDERRFVFTTAVDSSLRPADPAPVRITTVVTLADHPDGTDYRVVVRHADSASRQQHLDLGFTEGWTIVTDQLVRLVAD